jgi:hypothetical protein
MKALALLPVWFLSRCHMPFLPAQHPFHRWDMSLKGWANNATPVALAFGIAFWFSAINLVLVGAMILFFARS